jgi:hypothetical protein
MQELPGTAPNVGDGKNSNRSASCSGVGHLDVRLHLMIHRMAARKRPVPKSLGSQRRVFSLFDRPNEDSRRAARDS